MKQVIITVDEQGESTIDMQGFHGQGCDKAMADFLDGDKPSILRHKREYQERESEKAKAKQ